MEDFDKHESYRLLQQVQPPYETVSGVRNNFSSYDIFQGAILGLMQLKCLSVESM